jgi:hypothetical protein
VAVVQNTPQPTPYPVIGTNPAGPIVATSTDDDNVGETVAIAAGAVVGSIVLLLLTALVLFMLCRAMPAPTPKPTPAPVYQHKVDDSHLVENNPLFVSDEIKGYSPLFRGNDYASAKYAKASYPQATYG